MNAIQLYKLLHVALVAFFGGSVLAMLMVQSLLQRALDDAERKSLARATSSVARLLVNPLAYAGFLSGLLYWFQTYGQVAGLNHLMACTPIYVHSMLLFGILALGMAQAWKAQARKLVIALDAGKAAEARGFLSRGWIFAFASFAFIVAAMSVAILRVPNPPLMHCSAAASR
jgi:hypothetical protein